MSSNQKLTSDFYTSQKIALITMMLVMENPFNVSSGKFQILLFPSVRMGTTLRRHPSHLLWLDLSFL